VRCFSSNKGIANQEEKDYGIEGRKSLPWYKELLLEEKQSLFLKRLLGIEVVLCLCNYDFCFLLEIFSLEGLKSEK